MLRYSGERGEGEGERVRRRGEEKAEGEMVEKTNISNMSYHSSKNRGALGSFSSTKTEYPTL